MGKSTKLILILTCLITTTNAQTNFNGKSVKGYFTANIGLAYYQKYVPKYQTFVIDPQKKDNRIAENSLEAFIVQKYQTSIIASQLQLVHKLTVNNLGKEIFIIKFYELKDKNIVSKKVLCFTNENNKWIEKEIIEGLEGFFAMVNYMKPEFFELFCNKCNVIDYAETEAIKEPFKNINGNLDINKFGVYLKTKPKEMEKYCDF